MAKGDSYLHLQRKIQVLKITKKRIERGTPFICWALEYAGKSHRHLWKAVDDLKGYVMESLEGQASLVMWLQLKGEVNRYTPVPTEKIRATRLAWIDWMIQCLKEDQERVKLHD